MKKRYESFCLLLLFFLLSISSHAGNVFVIGESTQQVFTSSSFSVAPSGGDTIKITSDRKTRLNFQNLVGNATAPIVIVNSGGQVVLKSSGYPVLQLDNCRYIKVSGKGDAYTRFGFRLVGPAFGLSLEQLSSDCEAEYLNIDSCGLGIHAKKDYWYNPPVPYPVFKNLCIHDNFITNSGAEGMYIGETKSPGMEFRHLRIYNNVIMNSGYESFQIANSVEDVEVYNNICYNSGRNGAYGQMYSGQLGGNSIGKFYKNIFIKTPTQAVPVFGKGDMYIQNNYFQETSGVFSDDRYWQMKGSELKIEGNYYKQSNDYNLNSVWNRYFDIYMNNNRYDGVHKFLDRSSYNWPLVENNNNIQTTVDSLLYTVQNGIFSLNANCPSQYFGIGPINGLSHTWNVTPVLDSIPDVYVNIGDTVDVPINASVIDNDVLTFSGRKIPGFICIVPVENGSAILRIDARNQEKQVDSVMVMVKDASHGAITRQTIRVSVKDPQNTPPTLQIPSTVTLEAASKLKLDISAQDAENDSLFYTISGLPGFTTLVSTPDSAYLDFKPSNINAGSYTIIIKAEDGFSLPAVDTLQLIVTPFAYLQPKTIYRVNYGGSELVDSPINWQKDMGNSQTYLANYSLGTGADGCPGANNTGAPNGLFGAFRYNGIGMQDMLFEYPCEPGRYEVNLFFAERTNEVNNNAIETFSIYLEDSLRLDSLNIYQEVGYNALKKSFIVDVRDQSVSLKLKKLINNAKLNGVEIKFLERINLTPALADIPDTTLYEGQPKNIILPITDDAFGGCDSLSVTTPGAPTFITLRKNGDQYQLQVTPDLNASGIYPIKVVVSDCEFQVADSFNLTVKDYHTNPPVFVSQSKTFVTEGVIDTVAVQYNDPDNDIMTLTATNLPQFAQFVSPSNGRGNIILNPGFSDAGNYSLIVRAKDEFNFETTDTVSFTVKEGHEIVRIPLTQAMMADWVTNGSFVSPVYFADEQNMDPLLNQHPASTSWLPAFNMNNAPYYVGVNLGKKYAIKKIMLHDVNSAGDVTIDYGVPGSWTNITTYNTSNYNYWKTINTDIETQYIRLGEATSVSAYVNEIALYGYEINNPPLMNGYTVPNFTEGVLDTLNLTFTDPDNDTFSVVASGLPSFASLQNAGNASYLLIVNPASSNIGNYAVQLTATDSLGNQSTSSVSFNVVDHSVERIVLNSSMVVDQVTGGSASSPLHLVNEQTLDPLLNQHPSSADWYPAYSMTNAPFHVYLNLGKKYVIKKMYFHDINNAGDLYISYGAPGSWADLFYFNTGDYYSWRKFDVNISTQYVRLSQYTNNSAKINEVALYGYPEPVSFNASGAQKTIKQLQISEPVSQGVELQSVYPNPVSDILNVSTRESKVQVLIYDITGKMVKESTEKQIDVSDLKPGLYLVCVKKINGEELFQSKVCKE